MTNSMEEIVKEMEAGLERLRTQFVNNGMRDNDCIGEDKSVEDRVYFTYFNHFPCKFQGSDGRTMHHSAFLTQKARIAGKSLEEYQNDILIAIHESGVNPVTLRMYFDRIQESGLSDSATAEIYKELFVPIYLKLREMGYPRNSLC